MVWKSQVKHDEGEGAADGGVTRVRVCVGYAPDGACSEGEDTRTGASLVEEIVRELEEEAFDADLPYDEVHCYVARLSEEIRGTRLDAGDEGDGGGDDAGPGACDGDLPTPGGLDVGPAFGGFDVHDPHQLGRLGEELAAYFLAGKGYRVLERNYRTPWGEADLVCRDPEEGDLVLVEVKTRLGAEAFPEEAVDRRKRLRYRNITLEYLRTHEEEEQVRFDVMAVNVVASNCARLRHCSGLCIWEG